MNIVSVKDLMPQILEMAQERDKITIEDGYMVINFSYPYEIHLSRISTESEVIGWIFHLLGKNWMNPHRIQLFIEKCGEVNRKDYTQCG